MTDESQISAYYASKKILITGGTGFMGKVLIWKLLQSCPQLGAIYVLLRSKYDKKAMSRKEDLFSAPIFDCFKNDNPEILNKVIVISGDVGEEDIGLSKTDREMLIEQVSIVFHSAAILKMDSSMHTAINVNTVGTIRMLELAAQMKKMQAFVYISTAYCCCDNVTVEEKIYPVKHSARDIINLTRWIEPELLKKITPDLIHPLPNTYTYSKRLAESLLPEYTSKVPIILARPGIVMPAYKEPLIGWNDTLNGPAGFYIAGGKGMLRTTMMRANAKADVIPVDIAINSILTLPWANPKENLLKEISVYNITQTAHHHLTWAIMVRLCINSFEKYPFSRILWYPTSYPFTTSTLVYTIKLIFLHYLSAYIIDFILMLMGEKPFLVRAHDKLRQADKVLKCFTYKRWIFIVDKLLNIEKQMSEVDKQLFVVNMTSIPDPQEYFDRAVYGSKIFIFKEDVENLTSEKRIARIMYVVDKLATVFKFYIVWKILVFLFNTFSGIIEFYWKI